MIAETIDQLPESEKTSIQDLALALANALKTNAAQGPIGIDVEGALEAARVKLVGMSVHQGIGIRAKNKRFQSERYVLISLFFTSLAYGGWLWSEILYDQQVINSFVVLQHHLPTPKP